MKKPLLWTLVIVFAILLLDQALKIYIKTHMELYDEKDISERLHLGSDWFYIHFTENPGMAFGLELGGTTGKIVLSVFRLLAVTAIGWYGWVTIKRGTSKLMLVCIALIFAGALGNILDSCFYGLLFDRGLTYDPVLDGYQRYYGVAEMNGEGYAPFLHGCVVDMFHFPIIRGHFPDWFPRWGGQEFEFFRPVFNVADASISIGVILLIIFQKRLFGKKKKEEEKSTEESAEKPPETPGGETIDPAPETVA